MPMHHEAGGKLREEIRALGREQDAAARVVFNLGERERREEKGHWHAAGLHRGDGGFGASHALCHDVAGQDAMRQRQVEAAKDGAAGDCDTTVASARKILFKAFERSCCGQSRHARADDEAMHRQSFQSVRADLNCRKVPSRRETMMPVRKEEVLAIERGLHRGDLARICDGPEPMQVVEGVNGFLRDSVYKVGRQLEIGPQPETAGIGVPCLNGAGAGCHAAGKRFFMSVDAGFGAIQKGHHSVANQLFVFAGEAKRLAIEEDRRPIRWHEFGERERIFFAGDIDSWSERAKRSKGQDDGHLANIIRVTGAVL